VRRIILSTRYREEEDTEAVAETVEEAEAPRDLTGVGTVMLVEDEDAVRLLGARALRNKGYSVVEAKDGEDALEVLNGVSTAWQPRWTAKRSTC
jgi:two-component system cell cycle sensor histidine kinase/response regulator CckA